MCGRTGIADADPKAGILIQACLCVVGLVIDPDRSQIVGIRAIVIDAVRTAGIDKANVIVIILIFEDRVVIPALRQFAQTDPNVFA